MRGVISTLHCDIDDCDNWSQDYWEGNVSQVDGVLITRTERAPGWMVNGTEDICPECLNEMSGAALELGRVKTVPCPTATTNYHLADQILAIKSPQYTEKIMTSAFREGLHAAAAIVRSSNS